jgi:hypothetical protein
MYHDPHAPHPSYQGAHQAPPPTGRIGGAFVRAVIPPLPAGVLFCLGRAAAHQGGHHSLGDAALWALIGAGCATVGIATAKSQHSHPLITGVCLLVSAAAAQLGVATYSTGWAVPAGVAALFALAGYAVMPLFKRTAEDRDERREARGHELAVRSMELDYGYRGEMAQVQGDAYRAAIAARYADTAMNVLENLSRRPLPAARSDQDLFEQMTPQAQAFVAKQIAKHTGQTPAALPAEPSTMEVAAWTG